VATRYSINPRTVTKWRRNFLYALQTAMLRLFRSALHRCFQRSGISRLPLSEDGQSPSKKKFKDYIIGYMHVNLPKSRPKKASSTSP